MLTRSTGLPTTSCISIVACSFRYDALGTLTLSCRRQERILFVNNIRRYHSFLSIKHTPQSLVWSLWLYQGVSKTYIFNIFTYVFLTYSLNLNQWTATDSQWLFTEPSSYKSFTGNQWNSTDESVKYIELTYWISEIFRWE